MNREMEREPLVVVRDLCREYQTGAGVIRALRDVSFEVASGEIVGIMGSSGSGKSTLLFVLGLLLSPTRGVYRMNGVDVLALTRAEQARFRRTSTGFVLQSCNLIEHSTVYENVEYPLIYAGIARGDRPARIRGALERVNLTHRLDHRTNRLSGGEQQRVAIARALVNGPRLLLADEPTGQLDVRNGQVVLDSFRRIVEGGDTSMVVVTHDPLVGQRCDRVYDLEDGRLRERT